MFDQIYMIIVAIVVFIVGLLSFGSMRSESFVGLNSIRGLDATIHQIVTGAISLDNAKNNLVLAINDNLQCGNKTQLPVPELYAPGLKHSCVYNKKMVGSLMDDPNYKFSYSIRDLLTTIYVRSFEEASGNVQESRSFSLKLSNTFNSGLNRFVNDYNQSYGTNFKADIIYKGGNVIAIYTRYLVDKLMPILRNRGSIKFLQSKVHELKRGDWDYTVSMDHDLLGTDFGEKTKTFVLMMLQEIKRYLDNHDTFDLGNIAHMIQRDLLRSSESQMFSYNYSRSIGKPVTIEKVELSGITVTRDLIGSAGNADNPSKFSFKRPGTENITDTFQVDSLYDPNMSPMITSNVSIGMIEGILGLVTFMRTHFDLARLKFNNKVTVNVGGQRMDRNFSADIVDMSFIRADDTKTINLHEKLGTLPEMTIRKLGQYTIPFYTPHYLFYDLNNMLVEEGIYIWNDKKYTKRVDRYITIGLVSSLITSPPDKLHRYFSVARDFIMSLNLNNLDEAYQTAAKIFTVKPSLYDLQFNLAENHVTHEIIKSFVKLLIFHRVISGTATTDEQAYTETVLAYVYSGESSIPLATFLSEPVSIDKFIVYQTFVVGQLTEFVDILLEIKNSGRKIIMTDIEPIDISKL